MRKFLVLVLLGFFALIFQGCLDETKQIESILINEESLMQSYQLDEFDIASIELIVTYNDGSTESINLNDSYVIDQDKLLLSQSGTHIIRISYNGFSTSFTLNLLDAVPVFLQIYQLGVEANLIIDLTYEEWLESIRGEQGLPGQDGRDIVLRATSEFIQWQYDGETSWNNLISMDLLVGPKGDNGKEVSFRVNDAVLQWQHVGDTLWNNLFDLSIFNGETGENGVTPHIGGNGNWFIGTSDTGVKALGENGIDGITPHIGDNNHWFIGTLDTGIIAIGQDGITPHIGSNGNWFIGSTDTGVKAEGVDGETPYIGDNGNWWIGNVDTGVALNGTVNMDRVGTDGLYFDLTIRNGIAGYEVTGYTGTATDIIIPNEVFGQKVISIKTGAINTSITSISISKYTETLPSFQGYNQLVSVDFNHAPAKQIPNNGFKDAIKLETISNYENITSIGSYAFYNTQILFTGFDFDNIVDIGTYAFYISSVANYEVDSGLIISGTTGSYAISDQTFIYLPETVQTIGTYAFPMQYSIYYGGNAAVSFTSDYFFKNVKQTTDGYWYVDRNTYVGLLNYTGELTELTVPNKLDGKNVNSVENFAFIGDNQLSQIILPSSITTIGQKAFIGTRKLYILYIPSSIVNISASYFANWYSFGYDVEDDGMIDMPAPVIVFENNQGDMNFGTNTITSYGWGRYLFGYSANSIKQDDGFVYIEKTLSAEIVAFKNASGKVTVPSTFNGKPIVRINSNSLIGRNGGISFVDISEGLQYISTNAFYNSNYLNYVNVPLTVSAVNYQGFNYLRNATIYVKAASKPENWDSNWYLSIKQVIWGSELDATISNDLYLYEVVSGKAWIKKYYGTWSATSPIIIPDSIDGYPVIGIRTGAITYSSSSSYLDIVIPASITQIESRAINYYYYLKVYTYETSKPTGWVSDYGYSSAYGYTSDSYRTYYFKDTWSMINGRPQAN